MEQLTLGECIQQFKVACRAAEMCREEGDRVGEVLFDFGYMVPGELTSYRGRYDELAIGYRHCNDVKADEQYTPQRFLARLERAVGEVFEGYKGGEYKMVTTTPIWVARPSEVTQTAVVSIGRDGIDIIIVTETMRVT